MSSSAKEYRSLLFAKNEHTIFYHLTTINISGQREEHVWVTHWIWDIWKMNASKLDYTHSTCMYVWKGRPTPIWSHTKLKDDHCCIQNRPITSLDPYPWDRRKSQTMVSCNARSLSKVDEEFWLQTVTDQFDFHSPYGSGNVDIVVHIIGCVDIRSLCWQPILLSKKIYEVQHMLLCIRSCHA